MDENIKQKYNTQNINYTLTSAIVQNDCQIYTTTKNTVNKTHGDKIIKKPNLKRTLPTDAKSCQQIQKLQKMDYEIDNAKFIQELPLNEKQVVLNIKQEDKCEKQFIKSLKDNAAENYENPLQTVSLEQRQKPNIYNPFRNSQKINSNINPFELPLIKSEFLEDIPLQKKKQKRKRSRGKKRKRKYQYKGTELLKQTDLEQQNASKNSEPQKIEDNILNNVKSKTCLSIADEHSLHTLQVSVEAKDLQLQASERKGMHLKFLRDDVEPLQKCEKVEINIPDKNEILTRQQNINVEPTEQLQIKQFPQNQDVKRKRLSGAQRKRLKKLLSLKSKNAKKLQKNEFAKFHSSNTLQLQKPIESLKDVDIKSSLNVLNHAASSNKTEFSNTLKVRQFEHIRNQNSLQNQEISQESIQNEFTSVMQENSNGCSPFEDKNADRNIFIKQEPNLDSCDNSASSLIWPINLQTIKSEVPELVKADFKSGNNQVSTTCVNTTTEFRIDELKWLSPPTCTSRDVQLYERPQEKSDLLLNKDDPVKLKEVPKVLSDTRQESPELKITGSSSQRNPQRPIKVSITSESFLDNDQLDKLENSILEEILKTPRGDFIPAFCSSSKEFGCLIIFCANMESRSWLEKAVTNIQPWPGAKFKLTSGKREKRDMARFWIPHDIKSTSREILQKLEIQNSNLSTTDWKVISSKIFKNGQTLVVSIDENSSKIIAEMNNKLFLNLSKVHIKLANRR